MRVRFFFSICNRACSFFFFCLLSLYFIFCLFLLTHKVLLAKKSSQDGIASSNCDVLTALLFSYISFVTLLIMKHIREIRYENSGLRKVGSVKKKLSRRNRELKLRCACSFIVSLFSFCHSVDNRNVSERCDRYTNFGLREVLLVKKALETQSQAQVDAEMKVAASTSRFVF